MVPARCWLAAVAVALLALVPEAAGAQGYPNRPVTIVVPAAGGGPTDTIARLVANAMGQNLKQRVIVENVGGAGGTIGTARVVKSPPDGYNVAALQYRHRDCRHAPS